MEIKKSFLQESFSSIGYEPEKLSFTRDLQGQLKVKADFNFIEHNKFTLISSLEYLRLHTRLQIGDFSKELLLHFSNSKESWRDSFESLILKIHLNGSSLSFKVNGKECIEGSIVHWPLDNWRVLEISLFSSPLATSEGGISVDNYHSSLSRSMQIILALILSLFEIKDLADFEIDDLIYEDDLLASEEGHKSRIEINKYERSKRNRLQAILFHGSICKICNFDFEKIYGSIGNGFIHIHHTVPLHSVNSEYVINIEKDLIPLCPNCHSMVHKKEPPYSVVEMKEIMKLDIS